MLHFQIEYDYRFRRYGIKCDFADRQDVFILDVYNGRYFSNLELNDRNWIKNIEIITKEEDNEKNIDEYYLKAVKENVELSLNKFCPMLNLKNKGSHQAKAPATKKLKKWSAMK